MNRYEYAMNLFLTGIARELKSYDRDCSRVYKINSLLASRLHKHIFDVPNVQKDNSVSVNLLALGHLEYYRKNVFTALTLYNKALCFATKNETIGLLYVRRCQAYYLLRELQCCLENARLALEFNLPVGIKIRLRSIIGECAVILAMQRMPSIVNNDLVKKTPQLTRSSNPRIPFISSGLALRSNKFVGRHIITANKLDPGQIIVTENSYVQTIQENLSYERCSYCTKEKLLNFLPCNSCTNSMLCSDCWEVEEAKYFHQIECPISNFLGRNPDSRLVLRLVLKTLKSFGSITEMAHFAIYAWKNQFTVFDFNHATPLSGINKFQIYHSLCANQNQVNDFNVVVNAIHAAVLFRQLMRNVQFRSVYDIHPLDETVLIEFICRAIHISSCNAISLMTFNKKKTIEIGQAIYLFGSLVNHSCYPNVFRVSSGTTNVFVVLRNIEIGEQISYCYSEEFSSKLTNKHGRQKLLGLKQIECNCIACINDYPLKVDYQSKIAPHNDIENIPSYLKLNDHLHDSLEVSNAQDELIKAMNDLYGTKSAKYYYRT